MTSADVTPLTDAQRSICETKVNVAGADNSPSFVFVHAYLSMLLDAEKLHITALFEGVAQGGVNVRGAEGFNTDDVKFAETVDAAVIELCNSARDTTDVYR
jgi:hypothetical protein